MNECCIFFPTTTTIYRAQILATCEITINLQSLIRTGHAAFYILLLVVIKFNHFFIQIHSSLYIQLMLHCPRIQKFTYANFCPRLGLRWPKSVNFDKDNGLKF